MTRYQADLFLAFVIRAVLWGSMIAILAIMSACTHSLDLTANSKGSLTKVSDTAPVVEPSNIPR